MCHKISNAKGQRSSSHEADDRFAGQAAVLVLLGCVFVFCSIETYWTNPQFSVDVAADDVDVEGLATVIVGLRQQPRHKLQKHDRSLTSLGYDVYLVSCFSTSQNNKFTYSNR